MTAPAGYLTRLADRLGDQDPLDVLARLLPELRALLVGVPAGELGRRESPGRWSARDVVEHLADHELVIGVRYRLILAEPGPAIGAFDPDAWVARLANGRGTLDETLEELALARRRNLRLLRVQPPEALMRAGLHAERGWETAARLLAIHAAHDLVHLDQVRRVLAGAGRAA